VRIVRAEVEPIVRAVAERPGVRAGSTRSARTGISTLAVAASSSPGVASSRARVYESAQNRGDRLLRIDVVPHATPFGRLDGKGTSRDRGSRLGYRSRGAMVRPGAALEQSRPRRGLSLSHVKAAGG
jgi:hypothetical protein